MVAHGKFGSAWLRDSFPRGFIVKRALDHSSGDQHRTCNADDFLSGRDVCLELPKFRHPPRERYVVQEHIPIVREYRVHTLGPEIIPNLTFARFGDIKVSDANRANCFLSCVLNSLPSFITSSSCLAWDIAETAERFIVVEVNIAGLHVFYDPGFHCSGFFQEPATAPPCIASLMEFVQHRFRIKANWQHGQMAEDSVLSLFLSKIA